MYKWVFLAAHVCDVGDPSCQYTCEDRRNLSGSPIRLRESSLSSGFVRCRPIMEHRSCPTDISSVNVQPLVHDQPSHQLAVLMCSQAGFLGIDFKAVLLYQCAECRAGDYTLECGRNELIWKGRPISREGQVVRVARVPTIAGP